MQWPPDWHGTCLEFLVSSQNTCGIDPNLHSSVTIDLQPNTSFGSQSPQRCSERASHLLGGSRQAPQSKKTTSRASSNLNSRPPSGYCVCLNSLRTLKEVDKHPPGILDRKRVNVDDGPSNEGKGGLDGLPDDKKDEVRKADENGF